MAVALPPGAAATSAIRSPDVGIEDSDERLTRLVLRAWPGRRVPRAARRIADAADDERVGTSAPRSTLHARAAQLGFERVGRGFARVRAKGHGRGFVHRDERGMGVVVAEVTGEPLDEPVGIRERDRVGRGSGHGGPSRVSARSTALPNPRAVASTPPSTSTVSDTAAWRGTSCSS